MNINSTEMIRTINNNEIKLFVMIWNVEQA